MTIIKYSFRILAAMLLILTIISCGQKMLKNTLTVGSYLGEGDTLIFIAEKRGYFRKNGVNVAIKKYDAGIYAIEDIINDKIDIATPSEVAFVAKSFDNPNLRIFGITTISDIQKLLVRADSHIKNPADLAGKKIGTTKGSSAEFALYSYLVLNRINMQAVTIINLKPNETINAIINKEVDAVLSWEPHIYDLKKQLADQVIDLSQKNIPTLYTLLTTKDEIIQKKRQEITMFLKALKEAETYYHKNNEDSKILVKERINAPDDYMNYAWENIFILLNLSQDLIFAMENEAKWRIDNSLTEKTNIPNYVKYFYFDALAKIKPGSISIIR